MNLVCVYVNEVVHDGCPPLLFCHFRPSSGTHIELSLKHHSFVFEFSLENGELTNVCSRCLVFAGLGTGKQEEQASLVPGSIFWVRPLFLFFVRARTEPNRWAYIFRKKSSPTEKLSLWLKASITYSPFSLYLDIHYAQQGWKPFFLQNSLAN